MLRLPPTPDRLEPPGSDRLTYRYGYTPNPVGIIPLGIGLWFLGFFLGRGLPKLWAGLLQGHWALAIGTTVTMLLFAAVWIAGGLYITFWRAGAIFRRSPRSVTTWWQLLWMQRTTTHSLDEHQTLEFFEKAGHRGRPYYFFAVRGVDRPEIRINTLVEPVRADAQRMAAEVNALLGNRPKGV